MPDAIERDLSAAADAWLAEFEAALTKGEPGELRPLFHDDSHWRDLLGCSWSIETVNGSAAIADALATQARGIDASGFRASRHRTPARFVTRAGVEALEAFFDFETGRGRGVGVLRLTLDAEDRGTLKAWTLLTALDELKGFEERVGRRRPTGQSHSRDFSGPNWLDQRHEAVAYADRDPAVLVVGGGQAGLAVGARLQQLGVDTLIVDRLARIGDNWRQRYHALTLHNQVQVNHLPYMPFPPSWPTYIAKDKLAGWLETYAESLELNCWTGTEFSGGRYDADTGRWSVTVDRADGTRRELRPRHIVMATGVSGVANLPDIPTLPRFAGTVVHASEYGDGAPWQGRCVLVLGTGTSGHDIAQDLHGAGAHVTMVQRSPTLVVNIEPSAQLPYTLYHEGPPLEDCDLITASVPLELLKQAHVVFTARARELDKQTLDGLERAGFRLDFGEDETGWQFLYLTRGGGYYFNVGCSELIADGAVGLIQYDDIAAFETDGARMKNGDIVLADLVVLATGYKGQEYLVRQLFGADVADRVGPIWGFGGDQELRAMFGRTGQPGLSFIAGSLAQCRIYSKYLALRIKALEEHLIPAEYC